MQPNMIVFFKVLNDEVEKLKPLMETIQQQNDDLNKATSKMEKVNHKPIVDEKFDDIMERYNQLESRYTDKEKQVSFVMIKN